MRTVLTVSVFAISVSLFAGSGCRAFNYTDEEMAREQRSLDLGPSERATPFGPPASFFDWEKNRERSQQRIDNQARTFQPHVSTWMGH